MDHMDVAEGRAKGSNEYFESNAVVLTLMHKETMSAPACVFFCYRLYKVVAHIL